MRVVEVKSWSVDTDQARQILNTMDDQLVVDLDAPWIEVHVGAGATVHSVKEGIEYAKTLGLTVVHIGSEKVDTNQVRFSEWSDDDIGEE